MQELKAAGVFLNALGHTGEANPVDVIWGSERPPPPRDPVRVHPLEFAGATIQAKLEEVLFTSPHTNPHFLALPFELHYRG